MGSQEVAPPRATEENLEHEIRGGLDTANSGRSRPQPGGLGECLGPDPGLDRVLDLK